MADHQHDRHDGTEHDEHHGGVRLFIMVWGGLCVLTAISFAVANSALMNTPAVGWALMMAVSCMKAMLVITYFMHLKWEANWKYVLTIPASIMSVFLVLMLVPDVGARTKKYSNERWRYSAPVEKHADESSHAEADH